MSGAPPTRQSSPARIKGHRIQENLPPPPPALPRFDIMLAAPNLDAWREGNAGIAGVQHFEARRPGPHVAISALMHGNEFAGAIVLDELLRARIRPTRGRLSLIFLNLAAFDCFDAGNPTASRCIDEDMNRVWSDDLLRSAHASTELARARDVLPVLRTVDRMLDLHTMLWPGDPLLLAGQSLRGRQMAKALGLPDMVVSDRGHGNGRRLIDWEGFTAPDGHAGACILEAGQHWAHESVALGHEACLRFLRHSGLIDQVTPPDDKAHHPVREIRVSDTITAHTSSFTYVRAFRSGEILEKRGTLIARDGGDEIRTPYDDCVLVMPNLRPRRGHTAVRLAWQA